MSITRGKIRQSNGTAGSRGKRIKQSNSLELSSETQEQSRHNQIHFQKLYRPVQALTQGSLIAGLPGATGLVARLSIEWPQGWDWSLICWVFGPCVHWCLYSCLYGSRWGEKRSQNTIKPQMNHWGCQKLPYINLSPEDNDGGLSEALVLQPVQCHTNKNTSLNYQHAATHK